MSSSSKLRRGVPELEVEVIGAMNKVSFCLVTRFVRFLLHVASGLYFLFLLMLSTVKPHVTILNPSEEEARNFTRQDLVHRYLHYKSRPWNAFTVIIVLYIVGMLVSVRKA